MRAKADLSLLHVPEEERLQVCLTLLEEFGARKVSVNKAKKEILHTCTLPFGLHNRDDANPSARVNYSKLVSVCYAGCGSGGFLWWIASNRGEGWAKTRQWVEGVASRTLDDPTIFLAVIASLMSDDHEEVEPIPTYSPKVLDQWGFIHPWFEEVRGIPRDNIEGRVGWGVIDYELPGGVGRVSSERVFLPHWWKGQLVGWQSRRLSADGSPKYLSSPGFPKDRTLYNHDPSLPAVIVESPMTVLAKCHLAHMEATFGANVTDHQMRIVADHPEVVLWMDSDPAGFHATSKMAREIADLVPTRVVRSPWEEDPADLPDEEVLSLIQQAVSVDEWLIEQVMLGEVPAPSRPYVSVGG